MTPSAAAWFSMSAAEFKERASIILVTNGLRKDTERCVLLLYRYRYFYNPFAFVVSTLIFFTLCIDHSSYIVKGKTVF